MILVDTSVWVEFLRCRPPFFHQLQRELEAHSVLAVEWVFAELLQGARNKKETTTILDYWANLPKVPGEGCWIHAGQLSCQRQFLSQGIGLIDAAILCASQQASARIWTLDKKLLAALSSKEVWTPPVGASA